MEVVRVRGQVVYKQASGGVMESLVPSALSRAALSTFQESFTLQDGGEKKGKETPTVPPRRKKMCLRLVDVAVTGG